MYTSSNESPRRIMESHRHHMTNATLALFITLLFRHSVILQTGEITPGDNLVIGGIPKIPVSLTEEL